MASAAPDYTNLCSLFKNNTKLRLPGSCDQYIVCNGDSGQILSCEANSKYDAKTEKCVKNFDTTKYCENRCVTAKDGTWVANPTDCRSFYYCLKNKATNSSCGPEYYFDQTKQMCVYPRNSQCIRNVNNICELLKENTKFRDESMCSKYYKCEKETLKGVECKNKYFNVEKQDCDDKSNVMCNAHPVPPNTCIKSKKPYVGLKSDGVTCRGYFVCAYKGDHVHDLYPAWLQCPVGTFFDQENSQECRKSLDVKCNYNRCEGRGNMLVTSGKNNCRNYLVCENNRILKEVTCDFDYFFDERVQACVPYIIYDKCCDEENTHSKK